MAIIKHLYQRTIKQNGKSIKAWYFWYYDQDGKQVRKSCGKAGNPCLRKRDAQLYIANLDDSDLISKKEKVTLNDFCAGMYAPNSKYLLKCKNKGHEITEKTRRMKEHNLSLILDRFGNLPVNKVEPADLDNWLLEFDRSNSWRNSFLETANEVYRELYTYHLIDKLPIVDRFKVPNVSTKGILTLEEIQRLWPDDISELKKIWHRNRLDPPYVDFMFAVMYFFILTTGMRSGEACALKPEQFINSNTIMLNAMISDGQRVDHLKKGNEENKKWRVVLLPDKAVKLLDALNSEILRSTDYVFEYNGKPVSGNYLNKRFKFILNENGIDTDSRNISIHSLRFTNDTLSLKKISISDLQLMLGHTKQHTTEYYDRSNALDKLPQLEKNRALINDLWN